VGLVRRARAGAWTALTYAFLGALVGAVLFVLFILITNTTGGIR
jgi:hypothetical protein